MTYPKTKQNKHSMFSNGMTGLVLLSTLAATANQLLYKMTLNAFSSKTSNYGFFVSQFNVMFYLIPAAIVSCVVIIKDPSGVTKFLKANQFIFLWMGLFDSTSSVLGTMSGAYTPGELQTILNQSIIPMTMILAYIFIRTNFRSFQIWGSVLILLGSIVASSDFIMRDDDTTTASSISLGAVAVFFVSVIFSGVSNVYKDIKMKQDDLNEVHTSTVVSFWQLWIGFLLLPLIATSLQLVVSPSNIGQFSVSDMKGQLADGFSCFMGNNPTPDDDCSNAGLYFMAYTVVNFFYNLLLLVITKRGSAVLLVISQALALPVTNIAFTLPMVMGKDDAEPLSVSDLIGLVFVAIGFLTYSGFGFAEGFMVAQGPSGQMTYAHVESQDMVIIPKSILSDFEQFANFLVDVTKRQLVKKDRSSYEQTKYSPIHDFEEDSEQGFGSFEGNSEDSDRFDNERAVRKALEVSRKVVDYLNEKLTEYSNGDEEKLIADANANANANAALSEDNIALVEVQKGRRKMKGPNYGHSHNHIHKPLASSSGWSFYGSVPSTDS